MLWIIKMLVWRLFDDIKKNKQNNVEWKYLNRVHNIIWSYDEKNSVKINKLVRFKGQVQRAHYSKCGWIYLHTIFLNKSENGIISITNIYAFLLKYISVYKCYRKILSTLLFPISFRDNNYSLIFDISVFPKTGPVVWSFFFFLFRVKMLNLVIL